MNFKSKQELVDFVKEQTGFVLGNEEHFLNSDPHLLYTKIPRVVQNSILSLFQKKNIQTNEHTNNGYWIYLLND